MFNTMKTQCSETNDIASLGDAPFETAARRSLPLSASERRLLRALIWGEPLLQAAHQLEMSPGEARQIVSRLQKRAGVASRRALIVRAVAYRWAG